MAARISEGSHCGEHGPLMDRIDRFTDSVDKFMETAGDVKAIKAMIEATQEAMKKSSEERGLLFQYDRERNKEIGELRANVDIRFGCVETLRHDMFERFVGIEQRISSIRAQRGTDKPLGIQVRNSVIIFMAVGVTGLILTFFAYLAVVNLPGFVSFQKGSTGAVYIEPGKGK